MHVILNMIYNQPSCLYELKNMTKVQCFSVASTFKPETSVITMITGITIVNQLSPISLFKPETRVVIIITGVTNVILISYPFLYLTL